MTLARPPALVRVPAHGEMPAFEVSLEFVPPPTAELEALLVTPLADSVYKALKSCPDVVREGTGKFAVRLAVRAGVIAPVDAAAGDARPPAAPDCVAKALAGREIRGAGSNDLTIKALVTLIRTPP